LTGLGRSGGLPFRILVLVFFLFPFPALWGETESGGHIGEPGPSGGFPESGGPGASGTLTGVWYLSNGAGMALERAWSRLAALRNPYCLFVEERPPRELPELLITSYQEPWIVELRTLYKDGEESRRQWIFRDGGGQPRLVAVFEIPRAEEEQEGEEQPGREDQPEQQQQQGQQEQEQEEEALAGIEDGADDTAPPPRPKTPTGFIELYGENGLISLDRQLSEDGDELITGYTYNRVSRGASPPDRELLIRADTWRQFPDGEGQGGREDICTDYYRYTRNLSLRSIERVYYRNAPAEDEEEAGTTLRFPRRSLDSADEKGFVSPSLAYGSQFLNDVQSDTVHRIIYTTDERGRILEELRQDEEGNTITEIQNIWSGNRLSRIIVTTGEDERITEYEYNSDEDRIKEQDYHNGILERVVYFRGNLEEEELYMNGELILRSQWEGGRKLWEERVRSRRSSGIRGSGNSTPGNSASGSSAAGASTAPRGEL
jgi:hypothetical protein